MSHHITRIIPEQLEHRSRRHIFVGGKHTETGNNQI